MHTSTSWLAPAKINLFLHITGRRDDGMHELQTAFQFVDLCDQLQFTLRSDVEINRINSVPGVTGENDLCMRAALLLQKTADVKQGVDIFVTKNIPMGGGLGGASSDAATTLLVLNKIWSIHASEDELAGLARQLGADVPVFIRGQSAWAEGVGEKLTPINMKECWYLIVNCGIHLSTAQMFAYSQLTRNSPQLTICPPKPGEFGNVFEPIARAQHPEIDSVFDWLGNYSDPFLTGTGGCVVAAFADKSSAVEIQSLCPKGMTAYLVQAKNTSPLKTQLETE
ncbi:MAG: 4-(cytidine 5'-diphospho)-2-C-methyl-D-erythritol kinase [Gammaproteobacteria bacterium]|nr:4-(cytidine 5'-diphospho)-2-C-methyl-D-erythritol kinase [Gammaproteobacteria bacterium]